MLPFQVIIDHLFMTVEPNAVMITDRSTIPSCVPHPVPIPALSLAPPPPPPALWAISASLPSVSVYRGWTAERRAVGFCPVRSGCRVVQRPAARRTVNIPPAVTRRLSQHVSPIIVPNGSWSPRRPCIWSHELGCHCSRQLGVRCHRRPVSAESGRISPALQMETLRRDVYVSHGVGVS